MRKAKGKLVTFTSPHGSTALKIWIFVITASTYNLMNKKAFLFQFTEGYSSIDTNLLFYPAQGNMLPIPSATYFQTCLNSQFLVNT